MRLVPLLQGSRVIGLDAKAAMLEGKNLMRSAVRRKAMPVETVAAWELAMSADAR